MTLAALIDVGANIDYIKTHLKALPIDAFTMSVDTVNKRGIAAKGLVLHIEGLHGHEEHVHHENADHHHHGAVLHPHHHSHEHAHHHHHRKAATILEMIAASDLPQRVKERSTAIFQAIAVAEGKIHGMDPSDVHFHEVGAMDSIIDIIGVCLGLEDLAVNRIVASPVPTGYGQIYIAHGLYPIPAPATAELLKGIPLKDLEVEGELTTPTGAGILKALVDEFGPMPALTMKNIGYGAGKKNFAHPNVVRAITFEVMEQPINMETITVLECQIDDMSGEQFGYVMNILLEAGALDVYYTPVFMKKNRPGTLVTVLTSNEEAGEMEIILLKETTTFGVRRSEWKRRILERRSENIATMYGDIAVKIGYSGAKIYQISPEYEDVKRAAKIHGVPFQDVFFEVKRLVSS